MQKASFRRGSSGSPKHTETRGDGRHLMGADTGTVGKLEDGPRVGPGRFAKRVTSEIGTNAGGSGRAPGKPGRAYTEE